MASISFSKSALASLKKSLRTEFPKIQSSHLTEAIASALGFNFHAALLSDLTKQTRTSDFILLDDECFDKRLQDFGYPYYLDFSFETLVNPIPEVISTMPVSSFDIDYSSVRERAWRNLMVCTINEGLKQKLFTLEPTNYSWVAPLPKEDWQKREGCLFDFLLPSGQNARGYVGDAGFGELAIHVAVNPKGNWVSAFNAGFAAGDAFATGWLERTNGAWLQSSTSQFNCRKVLLKSIVDIAVKPRGFGDRGRVIM